MLHISDHRVKNIRLHVNKNIVIYSVRNSRNPRKKITNILIWKCFGTKIHSFGTNCITIPLFITTTTQLCITMNDIHVVKIRSLVICELTQPHIVTYTHISKILIVRSLWTLSQGLGYGNEKCWYFWTQCQYNVYVFGNHINIPTITSQWLYNKCRSLTGHIFLCVKNIMRFYARNKNYNPS